MERMGFPQNLPLSARSKELTTPASHTKSCITWAPAERSWKWNVGCTQTMWGRGRKSVTPLPMYGSSACSSLGQEAHLTSAEVQVQVSDVCVERQAIQNGPGEDAE